MCECVRACVRVAATEKDHFTGSIYLVFEFMDHDLGGLLNRGIEFTAPEIMCISKQILMGTHYIHAQKVCTRACALWPFTCTNSHAHMRMFLARAQHTRTHALLLNAHTAHTHTRTHTHTRARARHNRRCFTGT